ncbi:hypothetical protein F5888DRAFT_1618873 [Russula emetica]|nr:hypothetical protein F5888DRAFT_1618873 [Russula emetica]
MSAPQLRRRDASPSSSHGWHSSHTSERLGHNHHPPHHPVPRSLSEQGFPGILSLPQLAQAARIPVVRENGVRVQFGELWRMQRTVAIFIRHFWCPMCQDYLASLMRDVDHAALARTGVRLIVIGCGSYGLIRSYRQIFRLPYEIFVDASPGQILYRALGMGQIPSGAHKARFSTEDAAGSYVRHGAVSGLAMVVAHALRVGMPVWERGGDASQLGGEFVLGPGLSCTYVHRMQNTAGHAPIVDVLAAAGVRAARKVPGAGPRPNISLPLGRGADARDTKVLSVVREEACGTCGACEGCAEALNIELESTASGEWSVVVKGKAL